MPKGEAVLSTLLGRWHRLTLGFKFNLVLCLAALCGLILGALALDLSVSPAFAKLEAEAAQEQVERAKAELAATIGFAENSATDYAVWNDSYHYTENGSKAFEEETLTALSVANVGVNLMGYVRFDGVPRVVRYVDIESSVQDTARTAASTRFLEAPELRETMRNRESLSGFIEIEGKILAAHMTRVKMGDESGAPIGFVAMARELSDAEISTALQATTRVRRGKAPALLLQDDAGWRFAVPVTGLDGKPLGYLDFGMPHAITAQGKAALGWALLTSAAILLVVLGAIYFAVRRLVVGRVRRIDAEVERVAGQGKLIPMEHDPNDDELGALNHNFNRMVAQLKDLQEQIEVQSFQLGRSETSADVLHNARNSLNPVTVIIGQVLSERLNVNVDNVIRAVRELQSGEADAERRERLGAFLQVALDELEQRESSRREALQSARSALAEVLEILGSRSEVAEQEIPVEPVDLLELARRNAAICRFAPWGEIEVVAPEGEALVVANRLLLSQVVGNLMTNAVEAIVAADNRPGRIRLSLVGGTDAGDGCISLTLEDDGTGFDPAAKARLFERGESSKKGRSGGLGLHWCANTVRAMGGTLGLESEGVGRGAKATLKLKAA